MTIHGLEIDADSGVPVYRQIAEGIRAAVDDGRLRPGSQLPPTRDLASQLHVNRNTVVAAYEALAADGVVESHTGRGTFIATPAGRQTLAASPLTGRDAWFTAFSRAVERPGVGNLLSFYSLALSTDGISFAGSYPASDLMPLDAFRRAMAKVFNERGVEPLSYGPIAGYGPLREWIAGAMRARGSPVTADGILVTNGSQQALDLVFRALVDPGDPVVVEEPTYTGALSVLGSLGARLVGVPLDDEGVRPDYLAAALERHRPRVVYLQPTFQNPTTRVMGERRRRDVLALAAANRCVIIEDDWAGDLRYEGDDEPTLHALDGGRHVLYLSTFSKKFLPGLRVGWVAAPTPVLDRLVALKQIQDCGTSPLVQAALHAYVENGGLDEHLDRVRAAYRERRDALLSALEAEMPEGVTWTRPEGGLFLWVTFPEGFDSNDLLVAARQRGVVFSRGELFHTDGGGRNTMRLTYAAVTPEQIRSGVATLGELIRNTWPSGAGGTARRAAETMPIL